MAQDSSLTGRRIRERREQAGLKQVELAAKVGISPAYLNLIEHNRRRIGGRVLVDIAAALEVEPQALTQGAEDAVLGALTAMGASRSGQQAGAEVERVEEFAGRYPGWAKLIAAQSRQVSALERTVATLSDRMAQDPFLSASLHDVLSTVSAIRSTASILTDTPDIEVEWRDRFLRNMMEDSARLAEVSEALVRYLDADDEATEVSTPLEEVEAWMAARDYRIDEIESGGTPEDALTAEGEIPLRGAARLLLLDRLARYAEDALAMPEPDARAILDERGPDPAAMTARFGVSPSAALRRMAILLGREAGLVLCDASGTLVFRKPIEGFPLPRYGAACPLWPLYRALSQPMRSVEAVLSLGGRQPMTFRSFAISEPMGQAGFGAPPVYEAVMLLLPHPPDPGAEPVGTSCRICSRAACRARREPALVALVS